MTRTPTDAEIEYAEEWMRSRNKEPRQLFGLNAWYWVRENSVHQNLSYAIPNSIRIPLETSFSSRSAAVAALAAALAECREAVACVLDDLDAKDAEIDRLRAAITEVVDHCPREHPWIRSCLLKSLHVAGILNPCPASPSPTNNSGSSTNTSST